MRKRDGEAITAFMTFCSIIAVAAVFQGFGYLVAGAAAYSTAVGVFLLMRRVLRQ